MDSINFKANYVRDVNIVRRSSGVYKPYKASLVEMDVLNKSDVNAIGKTASKWDGSFTIFTHSDMKKVRKNKELIPDLHVYAITTQESNYNNLEHSKILGVIEVTERYKDGNKVEVLQTSPKLIKNSENITPKYKHIGQELIKYVKNKFMAKPLYVHPTRSAVPFYEGLGFKPSSKQTNSNTYWIPPRS